MILDYFPVLAYHKISPQKEFGLTTVTPDMFENQMRFLHDAGFESHTFKDLDIHSNISENRIIITFDDGYESIYQYALPILKKYNFKAVVFVLSDFIGKLNSWEAYPIQRRHRHLNVDHLKTLTDHGFEIGSHGKRHRFLPAISDRDLEEELKSSKIEIESITGQKIISFCYPYGITTDKIQKRVEQSSYHYAVGNIKFKYMNGQRKYYIGRRSIYANDSLYTFKEKIKKPSLSHTSLFTEKVIQSGAMAAIIKNILMNNLD